jgi:hypothetical protein
MDMPAGVPDTALGAMRLAWLFVAALFFPLAVELLLLFAASWGLRRLAVYTSGFLASLLYLIGVPIHEFSHALAALLTLSGVAAIKPLPEASENAFVEAKRPNCLGKILISLAPLFGGLAVLWLTARFVIPGLAIPAVEAAQLDLTAAASSGTLLATTLDFLGRFLDTVLGNLPNLDWGNWRTYVGLYIAFSVGTALLPSTTDLKIFLAALPLALLAVLGVFVWLYLSGDVEARFLSLQQALLPHLLALSRVISYAFLLTTLGVVVFLPLAFWKWLRTAPPPGPEPEQAVTGE